MAAEPIRVEVGDEVPVIIERIRRSSSDEVQLVLPARARFGQSRFDFQLLKQYCTRLGKRVAIWSPDPTVQRMAEESGFAGFRPEPTGLAQRPGVSAQAAATRPDPSPPAAPLPYGTPVPPAAPAAPRAASRLDGISRIARPAQPALTTQPAGAARIHIGAMGRRLPSQIAHFQTARYALYGGAALVLLAGILAVLFYVPTARVTLVAQAQPFSTNVDVLADTGARSPVHVRVETVQESANKQYQATGSKAVTGELASGEFTYVNGCPYALQVVSGQRLRTAGGVVFAQIGDTTIDMGKQQSVSIKAVQPGQAGNVGAGQITMIDANQHTCLTGTNPAPTSGGSDGQKQTVIQTSDIQGARADLEQQLRAKVIDELEQKKQRGETRVGQPQVTADDFSTTHNADDNAPSFTATLRLTAEGDYFAAEDVASRFTEALASKVPRGQQLTTNKILTNYSIAANPGGHLEFKGSASGYIAPTIDIEKLKVQLAGRPPTEARDVLSGLPVQRSAIDQSPPLPLLPFSASRITVDYGVEAQAAGRSG